MKSEEMAYSSMPVTHLDVSEKTYQFICDHVNESPDMLRLRFAGKSIPGVDIPLAITQIHARRKAMSKLRDLLLAHPDFMFPDTLSAEQCTALDVAKYHALVVGKADDVLDLTCGLGIDAVSLSSVAKSLLTCDLNSTHIQYLKHNANVLDISNIDGICAESGDYLKALPEGKSFSLIFADPARRSASNRRTYALQDCSPDILSLMPVLMRHTGRLMLKVSPMLDVDALMSQMPGVKDVYAVSLKGECKELLIDCRFDEVSYPRRLIATDILSTGNFIEYAFDLKDNIPDVQLVNSVDNIIPGMYLFEPNGSLMKILHHAPLAVDFPSLRKLGANTHLYVSVSPLPANMPGRVLKIQSILSPSKKLSKVNKNQTAALPNKANIVTRNYPGSPDGLKRSLKIKDGGDHFLYACRILDRIPRLLLCLPV